jgi:hypothetical protein
MDIWQLIIKPAEITFGVALLYFRFCLYETEEGHLQNSLIDLWIRISDKSDSARKLFERLLKESARLSERFFDALFGPRLLSLRALSISVCLLYLSYRLSVTLFGSYFDSYRRHDLRGRLYYLGVLFVLMGFLWCTLFLARFRNRWVTLMPLAGLVLVIGELIQFWVVIFVDFLWLVYIRRGTHWALRNGGIWRHILMVMGGAVVAVVCFLVFPGEAHNALISREWLLNRVPSVTPQILFLSDSRFFIAAVSLVQLVIIALGFLNWIVWPILSRVVYAAERNQFFRERKLFATFGFALLIHAASGGGWIKKTLELLNKAV